MCGGLNMFGPGGGGLGGIALRSWCDLVGGSVSHLQQDHSFMGQARLKTTVGEGGVAHLMECWPIIHKTLDSVPKPVQTGHGGTCLHPGTMEMEAEMGRHGLSSVTY